MNIFYNAHHAPIGAFASFTLGFPGASGGLGLELGKPANQNVFVALESAEPGVFQALPFYAGSNAGDDERRHFDIEGAIETPQTGGRVRIVAFADSEIRRDFCVATERCRILPASGRGGPPRPPRPGKARWRDVAGR